MCCVMLKCSMLLELVFIRFASAVSLEYLRFSEDCKCNIHSFKGLEQKVSNILCKQINIYDDYLSFLDVMDGPFRIVN